jgi:2-iminobutanoate/2-iminopropanoate deaminase
MKSVISTKSAPAAIGPYSQAIKTGNLVFISGQLPADPATGDLIGTAIRQQAQAALKNVQSVAEAAGSSLEKIVKTTCFLKDMNDFPEFNEVYKTFFKTDCPARSTIGVLKLPKDALVEVEAIAEL